MLTDSMATAQSRISWCSQDNVAATLPDTLDPRDHKKTYSEQEILSTTARASVDLRGSVVRVYNQEQLESCTANALCSALSMDLVAEHPEWKQFNPARLYEYYNCTRGEKTGVSFRNGIKMLKKHGICEDKLWPYEIYWREYRQGIQPPEQCYQDVIGTGCKYERILDHDHHRSRNSEVNIKDLGPLKACLFQGSPFVFRFAVYKSFQEKERWHHAYVMPYPSFNHGDYQGEHAVVAVGYNDHYQNHDRHYGGCFTILNSWGKEWGDNGYFYMPYHIITNPKICGDFWKISHSVS